MMMQRLILLSLALAATVSFAGAQTPTPTPPEMPPGPPIAKRAPEFAQWTINVTRKTAEDNAPASKPGSSPGGTAPIHYTISVTKTGDIRHLVVRSQGNLKSDLWCQGNTQITTRPEWKKPLLSTGENRKDPSRIDFTNSDFLGFEWISSKNFSEVRKVNARDCLVFKGEVVISLDDQDEARILGKAAGHGATMTMPALAYTDLETRLPVALQVGEESSVYEFADAPKEKLVLPPEIQEANKAGEKKRQDLLRKPAAP